MELIQHKINISPSDYEYVIDHFEKDFDFHHEHNAKGSYFLYVFVPIHGPRKV
jgi:hypothetical protein